MSVKVIKPGLLTTIQDLGRIGFQKHGVIASGAMDSFATRVANLLVGNDEREAVLEITMLGPSLEFQSDAIIAICGGDLSPTINGNTVPSWQALFVKKNSILSFGQAKSGIRTYLSFAGGLNVPKEMDSKSTYLRAQIGGFQGRSLKSRDILHITAPSEILAKRISKCTIKISNQDFFPITMAVFRHIRPAYTHNPIIRCIPGAHYHLFNEASRKNFFTDEFLVQSQSDRMGYRLSGTNTTLQLSHQQEQISETVTFGTVQVPADGNPIVLMADRQTTGGYPKIAQVISIDLPVMAQLKPGDRIRFKEVTLDNAQYQYLEREFDIDALKQGIKLAYYQL